MAEALSAQTLVTRALQDLGVYESTETLSAEDLAHGRVVLNELMGDWSRQGLMVCEMEFADASTTYSFPDGYNRAIRLNLAVELAAAYRATPTPEMRINARDAVNKLKRANWAPQEMSIDAALTGGVSGAYDIYSDS